MAECKLESEALRLGDRILITGPPTGVMEGVIDSLHEEGKVNFANPGAIVAFPVTAKVRKNDKVYVLTPPVNNS